jgi:hypothetical protein
MSCLVVRDLCLVRTVAGTGHVVFGSAVKGLVRQVVGSHHVEVGCAVRELS